jgi:hypothetical protein
MVNGSMAQGHSNTRLSIEGQIGAVSMLLYIQDLMMSAGRDHFSREDIMILMDTIGRDPDLFDPAMMEVMKAYRDKLS